MKLLLQNDPNIVWVGSLQKVSNSVGCSKPQKNFEAWVIHISNRPWHLIVLVAKLKIESELFLLFLRDHHVNWLNFHGFIGRQCCCHSMKNIPGPHSEETWEYDQYQHSSAAHIPENFPSQNLFANEVRGSNFHHKTILRVKKRKLIGRKTKQKQPAMRAHIDWKARKISHSEGCARHILTFTHYEGCFVVFRKKSRSSNEDRKGKKLHQAVGVFPLTDPVWF